MKKNSNDYVKSSVSVRKIFGFTLFGSNKLRLLNLISSDIEKKRKIWIATVNPEFVMETRKDEYFLKILQSKTTYNVVDGIGLVWANRVVTSNWKLVTGIKVGVEILMGQHRQNLITGVDLVDDLCSMAEKKNKTVFFYGGWGNRSEMTAKFFLSKYPRLKVIGAQPEDFDFKTKVDFLFVCRAMKKQELWINDHFDKLRVKLVIGLGRTFDYYSGELPRAPLWMRNVGLEWLYSWITDPGRRKRKLELLKFIWMVLKSSPRI